MDPEFLFLGRCSQLESYIISDNPIETLDIGRTLRQLTLDGSSTLVHVVNKNRLRLRFDVNPLPPPHPTLDQYSIYMSLEDAFDPYLDSDLQSNPTSLNLDGFLSTEAVRLGINKKVSVKDIIKFAANSAGAVHYDPKTKKELNGLDEFAKEFSIGGLPAGIRILRAIGRVALRGFQPLIEDVKQRQSSS